ncbi:penicillin-binding protein, 1A family [Arcobacter nitrofigilis DSM 7299]|uniref:Penicillin-binding protein, 1A family n=1 Tax=Arcobacter nitrofigilis (strain ATCC 33309 / DSM 7299 / CCUG 15893 / LMG 7604 / NCTC 12251 / CI) TaxID=572480 RepID=D5V6K8_ARCNC|nr:transglycosylase domain-containing protein [Arcobacter nitrofigilis]ADG94278.1 penicillin-binding protein, 1A family [Arcobacter nitrofigilis DSM 7299]
MIKYILGIITIIGLAIASWLVYLYLNLRFDIDKIVNYKPPLTTQFFDKNGELVANIFDKENRLYVDYDDIPPRVIEALLAIEDTQFFEHGGVNLDAISRALIKDIKAGKLVEGASTLTQQLVKTILLTREKKLIRKIKEALLSIRVEQVLTKEQILERYFNQVYFGHGYFGIRTAALGYFKKELYQLSLKEIAILVGLPKAPSFYDPTRNLKFSLARANQVIDRLKTLGWINQSEYQEATDSVPTIYNQTLTKNKAPYIVDYAFKELRKNIPNIKEEGYVINLTIDLKAQEIARKALNLSYNNIIKRDQYFRSLAFKGLNVYPMSLIEEQEAFTKTLNGGLITIENSTGKILSLVGGVNYRESSFNRVIQSQRQPGSSVKPFIYQQALDLGYSPASLIADISRTYEFDDEETKKANTENPDTNETDVQTTDTQAADGTEDDTSKKRWQPKNYEEDYKGLITLREALVHSRNLATINLVNDIGIDVIYKGLESYGLKNIPFDLSITLGSFGVSPIEFSQAYSMFSNNGIQVKPYIVSSITNRYKQTVNFEPEEKFITSPEQVYLMTTILEDVVKKGTGRMANVDGIEIAGKTGTSNNNVDAWFCGYSPTLQTIIWFGNDDNKPMRKSETGGRAAGPAFAYFYKNYLKLHPEIKRNFTQPDNVKTTTLNGEKEYYTETSKLPLNKTRLLEKNQVQF